uniref:hypothetical protein n=1 Tax=Tenacibaculum ovolyticum TaxID=104270 RepID=UPI000B1BE5FA
MKEKNEILLIRFNMILLMLVFTLIVLSCKREFPEKEIINHFNKYDLLSRKLSKEGKIDSALFYANELVNIASIKNDSSLLSRAYYKKGLYHRKKRRVDSAYFYYKKSNEINQKLKDSLKIVKRFFNIASLESENELYLKSDSTAIEGLKY